MAKIKHAVLLRFKSNAGSQIDDAMRDLAALQGKIPGILDFSGGPNSSPEPLDQGFTHAFVMTFADAAARDAYLPHPDHEAVKAKILPLLEGGLDGVIVLDWSE